MENQCLCHRINHKVVTDNYAYKVLSVILTVFVGDTEILNRFVGESSRMNDSVIFSAV